MAAAAVVELVPLQRHYIIILYKLCCKLEDNVLIFTRIQTHTYSTSSTVKNTPDSPDFLYKTSHCVEG